MRAIYKQWLVYFYPIFHCGLYCRAIIILDNLCTKQGNAPNLESKIRGYILIESKFKSGAGYNGTRMVPSQFITYITFLEILFYRFRVMSGRVKLYNIQIHMQLQSSFGHTVS